MRAIKNLVGKVASIKRRNKVLLENFFSLSFLQATNCILSFITLPYLARVLGVGAYGLILFAQVFAQYFIVITDYGFSLSAARDVSVHRNDRAKASEIFSVVFTGQFLLMLASLLVFSSVVFLVPKFRVDWPIYLLSFGVLIGNTLFPTWFFYGIERMDYMALRNLIIKAVFAISIFVFVKHRSDYIYVPLINSLGYIVVGIFSLIEMRFRVGVRYSLPKYNAVRKCFRSATPVFIAVAANNINFFSSTFFLGIFTNTVVVGYYAAAEKIIMAIGQVMNTVFNAAYPHISKTIQESREVGLGMIRKISRLTLPVFFSFFILFLIFAPQIVGLILGMDFKESVPIEMILSGLLLIIPIEHIIVVLALIPLKLDNNFAKIYFILGVINVLLLTLLVGVLKLGGVAVAFSTVATQALLAAMMYRELVKNNVQILTLKGWRWNLLNLKR